MNNLQQTRAYSNSLKLFIVFGHIAIAVMALSSRTFSFALGFGVVAIGFCHVAMTRNRGGVAHYYAAWLVCAEIFFRMTKAGLFWEFGKYSVSIVLLAALLTERRGKILNNVYFFYFLLLLPAVALTDPSQGGGEYVWRKMVSFYLSGPFCLMLSVLYFYRRSLNRIDFSKLMFWAVMPLIAIVTVIIYKMTRESIVFNLSSNAKFSGGFGPNQVSQILSFGVTLLLVAKMMSMRVLMGTISDWILLLACILFSLLTFSRGGPLTAGVSVLAGFLILQMRGKLTKRSMKIILSMLILLVGAATIWEELNEFTGGFLIARYEKALNKENKLSGRGELFVADVKIFMKYFPSGSGVGMNSIEYSRMEIGKKNHKKVASHTEYSRLLGEHGLLGVMAIGILFLTPLLHFFKERRIDDKTILCVMIIFALITMMHMAMRNALPAFVYGMAYIRLARSGFYQPDKHLRYHNIKEGIGLRLN